MRPATAPPAVEFPRLRPGLTISDGGHDRTGEHGYVLHDPLRHRFFRVPRSAAQILQTGDAASDGEAGELAAFLTQQRLVEGATARDLVRDWHGAQRTLLSRVLHSYLSFRIPLLNPEPVLDALLPLARLLVTPVALVLLALTGLAGLLFVGRQWDHFSATFLDFLTPEGAALYGLTLVVLKVFHELGHGFVARRFGVRVPVMGINFMVLAPMLFTEASDAWRLSSRRQRFLIAAAGVLTEMAIACVALFLWAFLPDGPARSVCYFIAATGWVMSLAVNLSPFMRFDGYHMLVDATGLHSIGPRAFALATWHLREVLFKRGEAMPEFHPAARRRALIALAWGTWLYRLVLFGGIALLVYQMFPKVIGLPLAAIEIHWFILKPVLRELKVWKGLGLRSLPATGRAKVSLGLLLVLFAASALPLDRHVSLPAVLLPAQELRLFAPEAAQLLDLKATAGAQVKAGDVLAVLEVPEVRHRQTTAALRLAISESKLARLAADAELLAQRRIIAGERDAARAELQGLAARHARLVLRAPFDGVVAERPEELAAGQWLAADQMLFHLVAPGSATIAGVVAERESARIAQGAAARFISDDGLEPAVSARLMMIGQPGGQGPELAYLAASQGGPIVMAAAGDGSEAPLHGYLPVKLAASGAAPQRAVRGVAVVEAAPESLIRFVFGRIVTVFLRESGF